ncbi:MAG: glycosyltransferase family 39 protein [Candidatus Jettenia sp.]|nr:MAG: glycosyltransferase family 39 protein [Candidatus Jettenia sp.]
MIPNLFSKQRNGCMGQTGKDSISLILILLIMSVLLLRGIYDPTVSGFADAERHLMGGAFILDFLCEMPISNIYDFTTHYYARYPAISIGYHPPFFPCIEAMFNAVFGINIWSSRLAILLFALIGVSAWFKLIQRIFDTHTAFWASLLLITTPYLVQWEWYTMAEIPALSMAMLTACIFYRFLENGKPAYLYTTAITFSLTVWTKQTAVFIVLWFILYLIVRRQFTSFIKRKETWIAGIIVVLLFTPLAIITFWLGDQNIDQSIAYTKHSRLSWENLKLYFFVLVNNHLTWPFMILCGTGFGWAIWKRDNRCMYFILLIMSVYLFFTFLNAKTDRYPIFWIPAFCLFAALPIVYSQKYKICYLVHVIVLVAIVIYQISYIYKKPLFYIRGYDEAVHYILRKNQTSTIFFDGRHKNYFIYLMRVLDEKKSMYVLRGNKLLTSSSITPGHWLKIHAYSHDDIKRIFDTYGISYIVVEKEDWTGIEIHKELRSYLNSGPFRLIKEIPIETNRWQPQTLRIYQYLHAKSITEDCLELRLPSVGKTLNVSIQRD